MEKFKPRRKKNTISDNETIDTFVKVQIFAVIVYLILFLLFCTVALVADLSSKYDLVCSLFSFSAGSLIVGFFTGNKLKQNGLIAGMIYSAPINSLVVLVALLYSDFAVDLNIVITVATLIVSAAIGGVVAVNRRRKR